MADKYIEVQNPEKYGLKPCRIIINQIKLVDKRRLFTKTGAYNENKKLALLVLDRYIALLNNKNAS